MPAFFTEQKFSLTTVKLFIISAHNRNLLVLFGGKNA